MHTLFYVVALCLMSANAAATNLLDQETPILTAKSSESHRPSKALLKSTIASQATSTPANFIRYFRYPIEPPGGYVNMDDTAPAPNATSYYRDVYAGAETLLSVNDSVITKVWHVDVSSPNSTNTRLEIKYAKEYNGNENCFIGSHIVCGVNGVRAYWHYPARCKPAGKYTMNFFEDGVQYDQRAFKILAQIEPGKVPFYNQDNYPTEKMGGIPFFEPTIASQGCMLTSLAMILSYHGVLGPSGGLMSPAELNEELKRVDGYTLRSQIIWQSIGQITNGEVSFARHLSFPSLEKNICNYGPQPVGAEGSVGLRNTHWMVATGTDYTSNQYLVSDPKSGRDQYYGQSWTPSDSTRGIIGPEHQVTDISGITIYLHSPAELLVTDPHGRRLGMEPLTATRFDEIPDSFYDVEGMTDQVTGVTAEPSKVLSFSGPIEGEYKLEVIGTGNGTYDMEIHAMNSQLTSSSAVITDVSVSPGERHEYRFEFAGTQSAPLAFRAGFNGGGQNPLVDGFLSYSAPTDKHTTLATGSDAYTVSVFFSPDIDAQSFHAELNRVDVTSMFHPAPGTNERVRLPLVSGRNTLALSVQGEKGGKTATDKDRLVFIVP